jgi:hypothetical protein
MLKLFKNLFKKPEPEPNPYKGLFVGWEIDEFCATSPDKHFCLWIANGLPHFADYHSSILRTKPPVRKLLKGVTKTERRLIWEALHEDATNTERKEHDDSIRYLRSTRQLTGNS